MAKIAGKREQNERSQKLLDIFANILLGFAIFSACVAVLFASLWFITSWYTPYENYKGTTVFIDKNGLSFRIEYPKRILANNNQATLTITLRGKISPVKSINLELPNVIRPLGLQDTIEALSRMRYVEYKDSAANRFVTMNFLIVDKDTPQTVKLLFTHSKTVRGIWPYSNEIVNISSKDLLSESVPIALQMETVGWAAIREFVNSSVGDKSPLILLASGLISWAGTYLLQYIKDKREQQKEKQQEKRETKELIKKNNDELWKGLKSDPIPTIKNFADQINEEMSSNSKEVVIKEFQNDFMVLKLNDWKNLLFKQIIAYWNDGDTERASQLIKVLSFLELSFLNEEQENTRALLQINGLMLKKESALQPSEADFILDAYKHWRKPIKPVLQMVVLKYLIVPGNIVVIANSFTKKSDLSYPILRGYKISALLDQSLPLLLTPLLSKQESYRLSKDEKFKLSKEEEERKTVLETLKKESGVKWRSLQYNVRRVSPKIYNWLKQYNPDVKRVPFGAEFFEFDVDFEFYKIEHFVFGQVGYSTPSIIFGGKGSGKTATASILMKNCQMLNVARRAPETGAFPIYCSFDDSVDGRVWLVESVSRALIDFVSDNPERFLMADASRRLAIGRLMLANTGTVNKLRTSIGMGEDQEEILDQVAGMEVLPLGGEIKKTEVLDLLQMAIPDGFNKIYFLMDVSERCLLERAAEVIRDFSGLSLQLARQGFFFKIFAPNEVKPKLGDISMFEQFELSWDDSQLENILDRRFERFTAFCDRKIKKPIESLIKASRRSPRRLIHYGNSLIQYAEANLSELEKLPLEAFSEIFSAGSEDREL